MTDSALKQQILQAFSELIEHPPGDLRFGQLIANLAVIAKGPTAEAVWDMEDDELLDATKSHVKDYDRRHISGQPLTFGGYWRLTPAHVFRSTTCAFLIHAHVSN